MPLEDVVHARQNALCKTSVLLDPEAGSQKPSTLSLLASTPQFYPSPTLSTATVGAVNFNSQVEQVAEVS